MNEFDNFVDDGQAKRLMREDEYKKAIMKSHVHFAELRKMEGIDFMNKPRLSEVDRKIQTQIFLANVRATLKIPMEVEDLAKRVCELSKAYEEVME